MKKTITPFAQKRDTLHSAFKNQSLTVLKKRNFKKTKQLNGPLLTIIISLYSVLVPSIVAAQPYCAMACDNSVNVSIPAACEMEIRYDMILEGTYNSNTCSPNGSTAFEVVVMNGVGAPLPTSPWVDSTHIGYSYLVKVKHLASGNSCWGHIQVQDKLAPDLICPPNVTVECTESTGTAVTGVATATDCSDFTLTHNDQTQNNGCNPGNAGQVIRTWKAIDEYDNSKTCVQTITIAQPSTSDVQWPLNRDDFSAPSLGCVNPNTNPSNTGAPTISGQPIPNGSGFCNMAVDYDDLTLTLCENSYKILRTWTVVYWCSSSILTHTQIIAVKDKTAPVLTCPLPMTVGTTSSTQCKATVILPATGISDDCSTTFTVNMNTPNGWVPGNGGVIHNINTGTYNITYQVADNCGNTSSCTTQLTVKDDDSPTVICDQFTVTTLNNAGISVIYAQTFDDGTYDNCGFFNLSVRRMEAGCGTQPVFGPSILLCCEDVGQNVQVEMKATDGSGNTNSCMVTVHVDDNSEPAILCPPPVAITCLQDPTDLSLTGEPQTALACGSASVAYADNSNINQCHVGTITRTWTATAGNGNTNTCNQIITMQDNTPASVIFPPNYEVVGCVSAEDLMPENLPAGFDYPIISSDCEMMATNVSDQIFTIAAPACFKIVRKWTVINKCTYQIGGNTGIWTGTQIIKVTDNTPPTFTCPSNMQVEVGTDCKASVTLPQVSDIEDCSENIDVLVSTTLGVGTGPFLNVNVGDYSASYTVYDGCGNNASCSIDIKVVDLKKPTPYCKTGVVIELMGVDTDNDGLIDNGMATTWANDLNDASFDNCSGTLTFSFSPNINDTGMDFDCDDIGQNTVQIWVTDASGNQDFCATNIFIQDNMDVCSGNLYASVGGAITNEEGENVENVMVTINDSITPPTMTGADGNFTFQALPMGNDFTVSPEKNANLLNGVTTYDIVLVQKHILNVKPLDSPYKIIAADVNKSSSVTTYDIVEMQKAILYVADKFSNNTSWRFIDKGFVFPNPANPFEGAFPEIYNINNFQGNMNNVDFVAVKIGDVNGTASPNMLQNPTEDRSGGLLTLKAVDGELVQGGEYQLDITSENFNHIIGYQFTLNFDPSLLEYIRVEKGDLPSLTEANFGLALLHEGAITTSWNSSEPASLAKDAVLFSFVFRAKTNTVWAQALSLGSTYTTAEAYFDGGDLLDMELLFEQPSIIHHLPVTTASPNPFHKTTVIGFELPAPQEVTLTVFDYSGRVVGTVSGFYEAGAGEIIFEANDRMLRGAYFYELKMGNERAMGKMVLMK